MKSEHLQPRILQQPLIAEPEAARLTEMMRSWVGLSLVLLAAQVWARSDLPNSTDVLITILADEAWLASQRMPLAAVKDLMTNSIASQDKFGHGTLESTFTAIESSDIMGQIDSETTVVVTLADCEKTHMMNDDLMMNEMNEQLIHFAVSDLTCNRLSGESFLLPVTTPENSLIQLVTDFK